MTGYTIRKEWSAGTNPQYIFLCSDLHLDSPAHDRELLKKELDEAVKLGADILIGGDVFEALIHSDRKRYTPSSDSDDCARVDQKLNVIVQKAYELLKPYAKNIVAIGHGNHEMSTIKFNSYDPIDALCYLLHTDPAVKIRMLHYTGIIKYMYEHEGGGNRRSIRIYFNHGQGSAAEISKGLIMVDRHRKKVDADIYWFGHTHTKVVLPAENVIYMNESGNLCSRTVRCVITGCYQKIFHDATNKQFASVNYGEEKMRVNQSTGGALMKITNSKEGYDIKIEV